MSTADDILYEPIEILPDWKKLAREITKYINTAGAVHKPMLVLYPLDRPRPQGSLTLEQLFECYHVHGQHRFFLVIAGKHMKSLESFPFTGNVEVLRYEHGHAPRLASYHQHSVRDMNLAPNTYTRHFVFQNEHDARAYMNAL